MGYVKVRANLWDVKRLRSLDTELIADTGAIYTGVPSDTLKKLGIEPTGKRKFKLANGNVKEYETGEAYID